VFAKKFEQIKKKKKINHRQFKDKDSPRWRASSFQREQKSEKINK